MPFAPVLLVFFYFMVIVQGFEFTVSNPTQCDDLTVTWSGGQPPFRLLIFKPGSPVINISIPSTAYQNSQGSFTTTLELPQTHAVLFSMSDATGITSGGISDTMVVGPSVSDASCNLTDPGEDFYFTLPYPPVQCKPYPITALSPAVLPINVLVVVALGQSIFLQAPATNTFTWDAANISVNSQAIFVVNDAAGHTGGSSGLLIAQYSDDTSCISEAAIPSSSIPGSTASSTIGHTSSSSSSSGQTSSPNDNSGTVCHSSSHVATIAGATAGGIFGLALIILLLCCVWKKSRGSREIGLAHKPSGVPTPTSATFLFPGHYTSTSLLSNSTSLLSNSTPLSSNGDDPTHTSKNVLAAPYMDHPQPYQYDQFASYPTTSQGSGHRTVLSYDPEQGDQRQILAPTHQRSQASIQQSVVSEFRNGISTNSDGHTGPAYVGNQPSQVIVHADIEETTEPSELPPQYSEHHAPIPGLTISNVVASSTAT